MLAASVVSKWSFHHLITIIARIKPAMGAKKYINELQVSKGKNKPIIGTLLKPEREFFARQAEPFTGFRHAPPRNHKTRKEKTNQARKTSKNCLSLNKESCKNNTL